MKLVSKILIAFTAALLSLTSVSQVIAVSGSDWKAGRISDDSVFTNGTAMNVPEIQAFLNARVPHCDTWGTQPSEFGGGTRAQYAASRGNPTPFTCLKDYYEVPKTAPGPGEPASNYGGAPTPAGAQSAAQLIANAAAKYNISPKVLLVKLATESPGPLTSDDWPFKRQYLYAMGAHCPDSGPGGAANCDANWSGFSLQMDEAAALLRWYLDSMTQSWWQYKKPYQNNSILWRVVESGCGAGNVYIESKATAALYTYTPYQPNQAALNNLYGTGDGCSSYGNRNFWRVFSDWFGSTLGPDFSAQPIWQQIYSDSSKSSPLGWNATLQAGKTAHVVIVMKNTGNMTWTKSGAFGATDTRLATSGPWGRSSAFCSGNWVINCTRPAALAESSVAPGQTGTFEFGIRAPEQAGSYSEAFSPVVDGRTVFSSGGMALNINVTPATFSAQPVWQQIYSDATQSNPLGWSATLIAGQSAHAVVAMKNTGNMTWTKSGAFGATDTRLATSGPWGRSSAFCSGNWIINCTRPAALKEASVAPGQVGTFEFAIRAPNQPGNYNEAFSPVVDGRTVFSSGSMAFNFSVNPAVFSAQPVWQQIYSDSTKTTALGWNASLATGQTAYAVAVMKNTGNVTWTKSGAFGITDTRLATYGPWGRSSAFCDASWTISCTRATVLKETSVAPGEYGTFEFAIRAPNQPGNYNEAFSPVVDGRTVFSSGSMAFGLTIQ